jgi:dihydroxyacetone kinase-like predicted kinase
VAAYVGEELPAVPVVPEELGFEAVHQELSRYRYCTTFIVEGEGLDADGLERTLEELGDSLLVVGDSSALKIHVHTDEPGRVLAVGTARGVIDGVEIANMHRQTLEREERLLEQAPGSIPTLETGVVAVVQGAGNRRLFESYRATRVIEGGQTMNPSAADILAAIEATPAEEVLVLPNNGNVILSAQQATEHASKPARVIASRSIPAGLAAIIRYLPESSPDENAQAMLEALESVATGEVAIASRDADLDGVEVRKGAWLGLADDRVVASGEDFDAVVEILVDRLLDGGRETLTLLRGADEPNLEGVLSHLRKHHPEVALDVQEGGQPHYALLLAAE